jgi:hypothetical protein
MQASSVEDFLWNSTRLIDSCCICRAYSPLTRGRLVIQLRSKSKDLLPDRMHGPFSLDLSGTLNDVVWEPGELKWKR